MLSCDELFILRKARHGHRPGVDAGEACTELMEAGFLRETRGLFGRKLRLTDWGWHELQRAAHARDKVVRAIAEGAFDHVPFRLFEQLITSPDVKHYLGSQQEVQRLMLLHRARSLWQ